MGSGGLGLGAIQCRRGGGSSRLIAAQPRHGHEHHSSRPLALVQRQAVSNHGLALERRAMWWILACDPHHTCFSDAYTPYISCDAYQGLCAI